MNTITSTLDRLVRLLFIVLLALAAACGGGGGKTPSAPDPDPGPPKYAYRLPADLGDTWTIAHAADHGIPPETLAAMVRAVAAGDYPAIDSLAVARGGSLVLDETLRESLDDTDGWVGNTDLSVHAQFSVSKSITSLLVGIAIGEGYIGGVDVPFLTLFPYAQYQNWDPRKDDITLRHVLTMRAGFDWNEWDPPYSSPDNQWVRFAESEYDYSKALLDLPMAADPGDAYAYNTAASVSLGQAIENTAPITVVDYAFDRLLLPLGVTTVEVTRTPTGLPNGGSGFYLRTRDALKFAQLLLDDGRWNGTPVVDAAWLSESAAAVTTIGWSEPSEWDWQVTGYGYQWWTGYYEVDGTRYDTVTAWGHGGQWVIAIPALDLAVAINSHAYGGDDAGLNEAHALVARYLLPDLQ